MRQRYSQSSTSGGDDVDAGFDSEDDACSSRTSSLSMPVAYKAKTWSQVLENLLWFTSAAFILYFGDMHSNFLFLLIWDGRIGRKALFAAIICVFVNIGIILCASRANVRRGSFKSSCQQYFLLPSAVPVITVLGLLSYCLFSISLWPIWGFLTFPLLFTLFMSFMVVSPYFSIGPFKPQNIVLHTN